jgi:hypothetical protein
VELAADATLVLENTATVNITGTSVLKVTAGANVAVGNSTTINIDSTPATGEEPVLAEFVAAEAVSPVKYAHDESSLVAALENADVTKVYYSGTDDPNKVVNQPTKELVVSGTMDSNTTNTLALGTLTITSTGTYEAGAGNVTVSTLNNGGAIVVTTGTITVNTAFTNTGSITSAATTGAIAFGANVEAASNAGTITLTAADGTFTAGHASAAFTNAGSIVNSSNAWSADPFAAFTTGKVFTNNGAIETIATVATVQKALIELAGSGTVVIKGVGAAELGAGGNTTQALSQNVEIATGGTLKAPLHAVPFSGGKTITITGTGVLDFGIAVITGDTASIGATIVNNGSNAAAIVTTATSPAAFVAIVGIGGKVTSNGAVTGGNANLVVPVGGELTSGSTISIGTGTVTVSGKLNLGHVLTSSGGLTVTATTGELNVTAATQVIGGSITINGKASVSTGTLSVAAGETLTIGETGTLTVASDNGTTILGSIVVNGTLNVIASGVVKVKTTKTLTIGSSGVIYTGNTAVPANDSHSVTVTGALAAYTAPSDDITFTGSASTPTLNLGTATAAFAPAGLVTTGGGYITSATATAAVVDALFVTPGLGPDPDGEGPGVAPLLTRKVTLTGDMSTSAVSGTNPVVGAGVIVTADTGTFAQVTSLTVNAGGELHSTSAVFAAAVNLTVDGILELTGTLAITGGTVSGDGTIISKLSTPLIGPLNKMLGAKNVWLTTATAALTIADIITVPVGHKLYATNAQGAYFGPGAYKVESATVSITPATGNFTLLSGSTDSATLTTAAGSITLPATKYLEFNTNSVQLGFGHADYASRVWGIDSTAGAPKLAATNGAVTIGPLAITGVATDGAANYASLVSNTAVVVYDVKAAATHAAPLVIDNVIVVLASGDTLKIAVGGEIKLIGTTAATGSTKFAGGGGILLDSSGDKLAVGSAVLAHNATDSSVGTAVAGKIVGTDTTTDTTSGITGSSGTFVTSVTTTNQFPLAAY